MNEQQLIADCIKQDRKAQKTLYEQYARVMYGVCLRYTSDPDDAKDLLQEGFIKVFERINSFKAEGSFEGWMKRIFINLSLEHLRRNKNIFASSDELQDLADTDEGEVDDMYNIPATALLEMIQNLPEGYAAVFSMYAIEDLSHREIAQALDISEGTSRSQYARARGSLQEMVKKYLHEQG